MVSVKCVIIISHEGAHCVIFTLETQHSFVAVSLFGIIACSPLFQRKIIVFQDVTMTITDTLPNPMSHLHPLVSTDGTLLQAEDIFPGRKS